MIWNTWLSTRGFKLRLVNTINSMAKRAGIYDLNVPIDSYNNFRLVHVFGLGLE